MDPLSTSRMCCWLKDSNNLISISQLCDKGFKVMFEPNSCLIYDAHGSIVLIGKRVNNIYLLDLHHASFNIHCFLAKEDDTWLGIKDFVTHT